MVLGFLYSIELTCFIMIKYQIEAIYRKKD